MLSKKLAFSMLILSSLLFYTSGKTPKLTVVIVIDQFAYHYIPKLKPFLKYGLKDLTNKGIVFENAYHPHGVPETTPGHHGLSVGTLAKDHGAIANDWLGIDGKVVNYADDPGCPELIKTTEIGKSNKKTRVDGLSDQFVLKSKNNKKHLAFGISLKSYPAISVAGRMGKAIWLDTPAEQFTSSNAYFDELPEWMIKFNNKYKPSNYFQKIWTPLYSDNSKAYDFPFIDNYDYTVYKKPFIGSSVDQFYQEFGTTLKTEKCDLFDKTPFAAKLLFKLAKKCVKNHLKNSRKDKVLLWISVSNLDLLAHFYGPDSKEVTDLIYNLDKQIHSFKKYIEKIVAPNKTLLVLTADHGIGAIPEISQKKGMSLARRIMAQPLVQNMNEHIRQKFNVDNVVLDYEPTSFRLNRAALKNLPKSKQKNILFSLKHFLKSQPGIKNAWIRTELENSTFEPYELENFYKNQIYKNRTGDIICQPEPFCQITKYPTGTSHMTPYDYDTHVPLILYQKGRMKHKTIGTKVWMPQLPVTLAKILNVGKPSASTFDPLPGF